MGYNNQYEVVRKMFWDGKDEAEHQYCLNKDGVIYALGRALKDYTFRTDKKQENERVASIESMTTELTEFIEQLMKYFEDSPKASCTEYDRWHNQMCQLFIDRIKNSKIRQTVTYGKAQKIVNMTMKTIYCLEGAEFYNDRGYFKFCHMPLDSILLDWFRKYVADQWYNVGKNRKEKIKISQEGGPLPKWSSLEYKADSHKITFESYVKEPEIQSFNNHYHYMFFVTMIREYFKEGNTANRYDGLTPLEAEFYIWPEMQYEQAVGALVRQDLLNKLINNQNVTVRNSTIQELNEQLRKSLEMLSQFYQ